MATANSIAPTTYLNGDLAEYTGKSMTIHGEVIANMLQVDNDSIYFEIIVRDDGTADVYARYNQIIGSRMLATIDASTLPVEPDDDE